MRLFFALSIFVLVGGAPPVHAASAHPTPDQVALDLATDYIYGPWAGGSNQLPTLLKRLGEVSDVSPVFLSNLLAELIDIPHWEDGADHKDEILRLIPSWAHSARFHDFQDHPLFDQIRAQLLTLQSHAVRGEADEDRHRIFREIWESLDTKCESRLRKISVEWPDPPPFSKMH